ncbi:50S ribosomal protein L32 [Patescibacteria group bacterium]|nr:50S ribosomal protein L32 [Patescibacteria group bacterium]MCL5797467.1 50S ribosomal protein L32 [Patescibacteria group bacterium]
MAPLPKRRHSSRRGGKREKANLAARLANTNVCSKCGTPKMPHHACPKCGFYK